MHKKDLDKLLALASDEEAVKLKIFYNASIATLKKYQGSPTSSNKRNLSTAEAALKDFARQIEEKYEPTEKTFPTRAAVWRYLKDDGWKISQATLYNQYGKSNLSQREDGKFYLSDVEAFARAHVKRKSTGELQGSEETSEQIDLKLRKAQLEVEKLEEEVSRARLKRQVEEGLYIHRDLLELELAARAAVLDAGMGHFFQSNAESWLEVVDGDLDHLPRFLAILMEHKDKLMNQYSRPMEFEVTFKGDTKKKTTKKSSKKKQRKKTSKKKAAD